MPTEGIDAVAGPKEDEMGGNTVTIDPLILDIQNWSALEWYTAEAEVAKALQLKGFCFINGFGDDSVRRAALREAKALRAAGGLKLTPEEAAPALLGPICSCWTHELASDTARQGEENLFELDQCLHSIGQAVARGAGNAFGEVVGRLPGVLHVSRGPDDPPAPKLVDPDEAMEYVTQASQRKIGLLYFLGGQVNVITLHPREDLQRPFCVMTKRPAILVYRYDTIVVRAHTTGSACVLEADFVLRTCSGPQSGMADRLEVPSCLNDWLEERFGAIADMDGIEEGIPFNYRREAALCCHRSLPVHIASLWHELPSLPLVSGGCAPFEASLLGGQDTVTEICAPRSSDQLEPSCWSMYSWGGKWDPDEYFDPDPMEASNFKMYTKHMSVLNRNGPWEFADTELKEFGIMSVEELSLDHRARMLFESTQGSLARKGLDRGDTFEKDVGFFVGMSGENQYWSFLQRESQISKLSAASHGNAMTVGRLSYYFGCRGPCLCIDTEDSGGMAAMDSAVNSLRQQHSGPFSFASSCQWIANPFETIVQCAAGVISQSGRTRVFDADADGFTKGEGVVTLLLELHRNESSDDGEHDPAIVGVGLNSKGASSSLAAPNALSLLDVVSRAATDARKPFCMSDVVEVNAAGSKLADTVELGTLRRLLKVDESDAQAAPLRPAKAIYGSLGPVSGLVSVARSCALLRSALHGPTLHLHQLLDLGGLPDDGLDSRLLFLTEVVEARCVKQLVGVSAFGTTGTSCHSILWGQKPDSALAYRPQKLLSWWPGGVLTETAPPSKGYYIVGTWTAWKQGFLMEQESEGVYGCTVTMGENNWERFQIWVDEDPTCALHPETPKAPSDASVEGPEAAVQDLSWLISGQSDMVRLINEAQAERLEAMLQEAVSKGEEPPVQEPRCVVTFDAESLPDGYEKAQDITDMPVVDLNCMSIGRPGDKYRIRLHVRGRYRRVEWSKLDDSSRWIAKVELVPFNHTYHVIGDSSYWSFQEMQRSDTEEGLYFLEVQLRRPVTNFQIHRDADWEQCFYPSSTSKDPGVDVRGPDDRGFGKNWRICGAVGDHYRIDFCRRVVDGMDKKDVRWTFVKSGSIDFEEEAKSHTYHYISASADNDALREMQRSKDGSRFTIEVVIGASGVERFQILLNANFLAVVRPSIRDATLHDKHALEGPDAGGESRCWMMGAHPEDGLAPGARAMVHLHLEGGLPKQVSWERCDGMEEHREYLAWGRTSVFNRQRGLKSISPWEQAAGSTTQVPTPME